LRRLRLHAPMVLFRPVHESLCLRLKIALLFHHPGHGFLQYGDLRLQPHPVFLKRAVVVQHGLLSRPLGTAQAAALGPVPTHTKWGPDGAVIAVLPRPHRLFQGAVPGRHGFPGRQPFQLHARLNLPFRHLSRVEERRVSAWVLREEPEMQVGVGFVDVGESRFQLIPILRLDPGESQVDPSLEAGQFLGGGLHHGGQSRVGGHDGEKCVPVPADFPLTDLTVANSAGSARVDVGVVHLLESARVPKNRHRRLRFTDVGVVASGAKPLVDDLPDALSGPVAFSGEALAMDEDDFGGHRGKLQGASPKVP